jgi:hypothetical protein
MSKAVKFRANASEINKAPNIIRYVWIVQDEDDGVTTSTTYQTLSRLLGKRLAKIHLLDIRDNLLYVWDNPTEEFYEKLINEWRENYFNLDWKVSTN